MAVVQAAQSQIGQPYVYGGGNCAGHTVGIPGPGFDGHTLGFDCSGLAMYAWCQVGVHLTHQSGIMFATIPHVRRANLAPGDLVFFYHPIHHVAVYAGGGQIVTASSGSVHMDALSNWDRLYAGAARPRGATSGGGGGGTSDPLYDLLGRAGFSEHVIVPLEPHGLSAREMAWCIAQAESNGNLSPGGNLFQITGGAPSDPLANARRAVVISTLGTQWVAWCTAFGGPRVNPRPGVPTGSRANCGHKGPNYLRTTAGIEPAYYAHVAQAKALRSGAGPVPRTGHGHAHDPNAGVPAAKASSLPANCGETKAVAHLLSTCPECKGPGILSSACAQCARAHNLTVQQDPATVNVGGAIRGVTGHIPVIGAVVTGVSDAASFFEHLPAYLKITAGGLVLIGGLALVVAGATGNTSKLSQQTSQVIMRTPAGRVVERRRAIGAERTTQRRRSARAEAEARVDSTGRTTRRRVYRAQTAAADRARAAGVEAETGETVNRRVINLRQRETA